MRKALKNDLISEVKKMNQINMNTIGKNAYTVSEFEFYKDAIEKDDNMSDKERKIREITYGGLIKIDELISLDDPKAYKKYIELPATEYEKGLLLIEQEEYRLLLELATKMKFNDTIRKIDSFNKAELQKIWVKEINKDYKKHQSIDRKIGNSESLLRKTNPNCMYCIIEPKSILHQKPENIYEWLKSSKYRIEFSKIVNHKSKFFFEKAIVFDKENINWALEQVEPDRFEIIKLLLDNGAQLLKHWNDEEGYTHSDADTIGTEILRKKINEVLEG